MFHILHRRSDALAPECVSETVTCSAAHYTSVQLCVDSWLSEWTEERENMKRQFYKDYLTAIVSTQSVKWVTDGFTKDRRIALYGLDLAIDQEGAKVSLSPVIPCCGPLADLVRKHPKATDFRFDRNKRKWKLA